MLRSSVTINLLLLLGLFCLPALAQEPAAAGPALFWEQPDSAYINLLRSLKHNRFEVHFIDGAEFTGRATVTDSGLVLVDYQWRGGTKQDGNRTFARWNEIQNIRALKKESSWPAAAIAGAAGFLLLIIYFGAR